MKQFFEDLIWVIIDVLESIGELIVYNIMAVVWVCRDIRDVVIDTYHAIRNGELDDE